MISRKNNLGGMLIDVIIAFGIIALMSTLTIPYIKRYQPNLKLNAAARNLASDLRYAQQLTITEQKIHATSFDLANNKYDILKIDSATTTVKTVFFDPEVSFKQITGLANNQAVFNFYGGVSQPGQIILTNINNIDAAINIKPSGYIQLTE